MPDTLPISCFIIAQNEADRIGATIESVRGLVSEVIVVDSGSTDGTQDVARRHGATVIHHEWKGYGPQKRFAETQCKNLWLLNLDADELLTSALREEIRTAFMSGEPEIKAWFMNIVEVLPGQKVPNRFSHIVKAVRFYHRDAGAYSESPVHDRVQLKPGTMTKVLEASCEHRSSRGIFHSVEKLNRYSSMLADDMQSKARSKYLSALLLPIIFLLAFLKAYLFRKYVFQGMSGFVNSMIYAMSRFLKFAKHWEKN
jgi:glycosyltransferase involved in cell wall biosynthesis